MKPTIVAVTELLAPQVQASGRFSSQLRRADDYIKLGVAGVEQICPPADDTRDKAKTGLFVGTAFGPMQTNFDVLGLIVDEDQTSPTLFSHSVFNSAAGYIARLFGIAERTFSLTDFSWPFFRALAEGAGSIASGCLDRAIVLQVETYSDLLADARVRTEGESLPWQPGVVAWHLAAAGEGLGWQLETIDIHTLPAEPQDFIHRREILECEAGAITCASPLAAAATISELLQRTDNRAELNCRLSAPYGSVSLLLQPGSSS